MNKRIIITGGNGQDAQILARKIKSYKVNILIHKKHSSFLNNKNINYNKINLTSYLEVYNQIKKIKRNL